jgi:hypothetical protein
MTNIESKFNELEKGNCIGKYVAPEPKPRYIYNREICPDLRGGLYTSLSFNGINGAKSVNISSKELLHGRKKVKSGERSPIFDGQYRSPVYKPYPYECKKLEEKNFNGPFEQSKNPMIEKIIIGNKKLYFGVVKDKLITYSVFQKNNCKQIKIHSIKKTNFLISRKILKKYALEVLEKLKFNEQLKTEYNKENISLVYSPRTKESGLNLKRAI